MSFRCLKCHSLKIICQKPYILPTLAIYFLFHTFSSTETIGVQYPSTHFYYHDTLSAGNCNTCGKIYIVWEIRWVCIKRGAMSQDSLIKMPYPCVVCDQEVRPRQQALECESDFEQGSWLAIKSLFPNAVVKGCAFHWGQSIWRHVQSIGLQVGFIKITFDFNNVNVH